MDIEITVVFEMIQTQKYIYHVFFPTEDPSFYCIYVGIIHEIRNDNVGLEDIKAHRTRKGRGAGGDRGQVQIDKDKKQGRRIKKIDILKMA